jgi:hypothetical protein
MIPTTLSKQFGPVLASHAVVIGWRRSEEADGERACGQDCESPAPDSGHNLRAFNIPKSRSSQRPTQYQTGREVLEVVRYERGYFYQFVIVGRIVLSWQAVTLSGWSSDKAPQQSKRHKPVRREWNQFVSSNSVGGFDHPHLNDHCHIEFRMIPLHVFRSVLLPKLLDHGLDTWEPVTQERLKTLRPPLGRQSESLGF